MHDMQGHFALYEQCGIGTTAARAVSNGAAAQVFMLSADALVDEALLLSILESGHSRVPVHKPGSR